MAAEEVPTVCVAAEVDDEDGLPAGADRTKGAVGASCMTGGSSKRGKEQSPIEVANQTREEELAKLEQAAIQTSGEEMEKELEQELEVVRAALAVAHAARRPALLAKLSAKRGAKR